MRKLAALTAVLVLSACASSSQDIKPVANPGPCTSADRARLEALSNQQDNVAKRDAAGVFWIGLPTGSMGGVNNEAEIALLKGRCQKG